MEQPPVHSPSRTDPHDIPTDLPHGLAPWIEDWIREAVRENEVLIANGAATQATARCRLLVSLIEAARQWLDSQLDATEAALEAGCCEETIRRAVRRGVLADQRPGGRGRHRIRRGDLVGLHGDYDPQADAADILLRRRRRPGRANDERAREAG